MTLDNPEVYYSDRILTPLYDDYLDWTSWLEELLPVWASEDRGSVQYDFGDVYARVTSCSPAWRTCRASPGR